MQFPATLQMDLTATAPTPDVNNTGSQTPVGVTSFSN